MWRGKGKRLIQMSRGFIPSMQGWLRVAFFGAFLVLGSHVRANDVALEPVSSELLPFAADDLDRRSLIVAVQQSLTALRKKSATETLAFGNQQVTVRRVRDGLEVFLSLLQNHNEPDFGAILLQHFDLFRPSSSILFTGYHEPVLNGSLVQTKEYQYPLYRPLDPALGGSGNTALSRADIDGRKALAGKGYELMWLEDPIDRFFLHIQGSGMVRLPGGTFLRVGYAGDNGRPYRSIGKLLLEEGKLQSGNTSTYAIRQYLRNHPEERDAILFHNARYIFFQLVENGPLGSLGVPLTAGRSLAVDPSIYPAGSLAFIHTKRPVLNRARQVQWKDFFRFVLLQDTGGAIKGPTRADLFWGQAAEAEAGLMAQYGELYLLVKRSSPEQRVTSNEQ